MKKKDSYLRVQFLRLKARRGAKKAMVVVASMLTAAYHMLKNDVEYQDLGADYFARRPPPISSGACRTWATTSNSGLLHERAEPREVSYQKPY